MYRERAPAVKFATLAPMKIPLSANSFEPIKARGTYSTNILLRDRNAE
jgi:hypothetical protein